MIHVVRVFVFVFIMINSFIGHENVWAAEYGSFINILAILAVVVETVLVMAAWYA
jgi:hypothetical protein